MSSTTDKSRKIGNEITVRISLTFQEAPDIHTLLAMTPVRERGKLVREALTWYIKQTSHPAGDVEQQISAISTWLRSRALNYGEGLGPAVTPGPRRTEQPLDPLPIQVVASGSNDKVRVAEISPASLGRWLDT